jgi:hypothetical protein
MQAIEIWRALAVPLGVLAATLAAGYFGKRTLLGFVHRRPAAAGNRAVRIAVFILRKRFMFWVLILGVHLASQVSPVLERSAGQVEAFLLAAWILLLAVACAQVAARLVKGSSCAFGHDWTWPRRRAGIDTQVCRACGCERRSPIQFGARWQNLPFSSEATRRRAVF